MIMGSQLKVTALSLLLEFPRSLSRGSTVVGEGQLVPRRLMVG